MVAARSFGQAPSLASRAAAGDLPPVEQRVPGNPVLLQPEDRVGVYGGTLEVFAANPAVRFHRIVGGEALVRWDLQWKRVLPNVAQAVEVSEDATSFTFHLRRGMRWSDGVPFTAADVLFWYERVLLEPALTPRPMSFLVRAGSPVELEVIDDNTVAFRFSEANPFFLKHMAGTLGSGPTRYPRHYLGRFHAAERGDQAPGNREGGDWVAEFKTMADAATNPDLPTLNAWVLRSTAVPLVAERNPYYWKIDTEYQQLPYLDRVLVRDEESLDEAAGDPGADTGRLLFADDFGGVEGCAEMAKHMDRVTLIPNSSSVVAVALNLNHHRPRLRSLFQSKDFRIGLSHAIDRPRLIRDLLGGHSEAFQVAPRPESAYYNERLARQYTDYDVELAGGMLDRAGCAQRDAEGWRLAPGGERVSFRLQGQGTDPRYLERIAADWQTVGIDVAVVEYGPERRSEWVRELYDNRFDTYVSEGVGGLDVMLESTYYVPSTPHGSWFAPGWGFWNRDPDDPRAVKPPEAVRRQLVKHARLQRTVDPDEQQRLMREILEVAADEFYVIGTALMPPSQILVSPRLQNVPPVMPSALIPYPMPAPSNPCQYFLAPERAELAVERSPR